MKLVGLGFLLLSGLLLAFPSAAYSAGELDTSFGDQGVVREISGDSLLNPTGAVDGDRILVAASESNGNSTGLVMLIFDQDGSVAETIRYEGTTVSDYEFVPHALAVDGVGRILIGGRAFGVPGSDSSDLGLVRLSSDGSLDTTFGDGGVATVDLGLANEWAVDVAADSQGRYLMVSNGSSSSPRLAVVRLLANGDLDITYGSNGASPIPEVGRVLGKAVATDSADRPVVSFAVPGFSGGGILRLSTAGSLDPTFGSGGVQDVPFGDGGIVESLTLDDSGRILVAGAVREGAGEPETLSVARFGLNGEIDNAFGSSGVATSSLATDFSDPTSTAIDVAVDPSGFVIAGGVRQDVSQSDSDIEAFVSSFAPSGDLDTELVISPASAASLIVDVAVDDHGRAVVVGRDWEISESQNGTVVGPESVMVARFTQDAFGFRGRFSDDDNSVFENAIERLAAAGITEGCNPPHNDEFCPGDNVTRGQMAVFLARGLDYTEDGGEDFFTDDDGEFYENAANRIRFAGVTQGCNPPDNDEYCGDEFVNRGQMAAFLVRALGLTDDGGGDLFIDDDDSIFEVAIDRLGTAGITQGCNPPDNDEFCPTDFVTRGQMAAFLVRAGLAD